MARRDSWQPEEQGHLQSHFTGRETEARAEDPQPGTWVQLPGLRLAAGCSGLGTQGFQTSTAPAGMGGVVRELRLAPSVSSMGLTRPRGKSWL